MKRTTFRFEERVTYGPSVPAPPRAPVKGKARVLAFSILALVFTVIGLAMFALFTQVRITMPYGPAWWTAAALMAAGSTGVLAWKWQRNQVATPANPEPKRLGWRQLVPLSLAMGGMSFEGVLGGVPALLHHLTSEPGEKVVTVSGKQSNYQRYSCHPRLIIAEFTYGPKNHLCPSETSFAQIAVGQKVRVQGTVSPFGVEPRYMIWSGAQKGHPEG